MSNVRIDIYNNFILEYYKEHDDKLFDKVREYNENFNKVEKHESFTNTNEKGYEDDIELETFMGKYFVPPYQYKEFDDYYLNQYY